RAAAGGRPWTWLVVSDAQALLPWEMVCPGLRRPDTGEWWYDDFLAGRFLISHWIAREGLTLAGEAPLRRIDLTHYRRRPEALPRWWAALGGAGHADEESWDGPFALTLTGSPHFGLHMLRYADRRRAGRITQGETPPDRPAPKDSPDTRIHSQRLDLTR